MSTRESGRNIESNSWTGGSLGLVSNLYFSLPGGETVRSTDTHRCRCSNGSSVDRPGCALAGPELNPPLELRLVHLLEQDTFFSLGWQLPNCRGAVATDEDIPEVIEHLAPAVADVAAEISGFSVAGSVSVPDCIENCPIPVRCHVSYPIFVCRRINANYDCITLAPVHRCGVRRPPSACCERPAL
jgi:hypothetical protein